MKLILSSLFAVLFALAAQAEEPHITIRALIQDGENLMTAPSVTLVSGKKGTISITKEHIQDVHLMLPVGVIIDTTASKEDDKITYSVLLTIREHVDIEGDSSNKTASTFTTRELMLSGTTAPGEKVSANVDETTTLTLTFK